MTKGSKIDSVARIKMHFSNWSTNIFIWLNQISSEENSEKLSDFLINITRNQIKS